MRFIAISLGIVLLLSGCMSEAMLNSQAFSHDNYVTHFRQGCVSSLVGWEQSKKDNYCRCAVERMRSLGLTVRELRDISLNPDRVLPWAKKLQLDCSTQHLFDGQRPEEGYGNG